jgi:hypothetical protein
VGDTGVRAARAATLIRLTDDGVQDAIRFVRAGSRVHIITEDDNRAAARSKALLGEGSTALAFLLGDTWTVCGSRFSRHAGGFEQGAELVSHFLDEQLCPHCHAAFGDRGEVIFEANSDDGQDSTQVGRLLNDSITKGTGPLQ